MKITQGPSLSCWLQTDDNTLAILHRFPSELDTMRHFAWDTEVFEESLMSWPELSPHRFLHAMLCKVAQIRCTLACVSSSRSVWPTNELED